MCSVSFCILREIHTLCSCDGGTKGGKTQLLASNLTLLVTELQNLDDTGGIRKNICRWNITAGRELLFFSLFFYTNVPDHGREMVSEDMQILCSHL